MNDIEVRAASSILIMSDIHMIHFDEAHRAVHYPDDRRFRVWIRPSVLIVLLVLLLGPLVLAWMQTAIFASTCCPISNRRARLQSRMSALRLILLTNSLGVGLAVWIEEFFATLLPRRF